MTLPGVDSVAAEIALSMTVIALLLAVVRLILGPSLPDRVVALDLISVLVASATAIYAVGSEQAVFLDVAIVVSLITFLGTVAFARYVEMRARSD